MDWIIIGIGSIILLIIIIFIVDKYSGQCPSCKEFKVAQLLEEVPYHYEETMKTKIVYDTHYDKKRKITGRTRREIVVPIARATMQYNYQCKRCNHKWQERKTVEKQL